MDSFELQLGERFTALWLWSGPSGAGVPNYRAGAIRLSTSLVRSPMCALLKPASQAMGCVRFWRCKSQLLSHTLPPGLVVESITLLLLTH